jgi:pimeloyl-ACP methyl ester carboxylesterase
MTGENSFTDFFYQSHDGLRLHARLYGKGSEHRLPVVCLPGLTRNARDFHELALYLISESKASRQVIAFDYRGRGMSSHDDNIANYTVPVEAADVIAGLKALGIFEAAFIGTSRGGLIVYLLGAMQPGLLKAVILNDIGPAIEPAGLDRIRAYLDRAPKPKAFSEVVEALRGVHGESFPALRPVDWETMAAALYRDAGDGRFVPDFDPNLVDTLSGLDLTKPLPTLWPQFEALSHVPMMAIRGENSQLLSTATLAEMKRRHPRLRVVTVAGQGHAPFLETGALPETISSFLAEAEGDARL